MFEIFPYDKRFQKCLTSENWKFILLRSWDVLIILAHCLRFHRTSRNLNIHITISVNECLVFLWNFVNVTQGKKMQEKITLANCKSTIKNRNRIVQSCKRSFRCALTDFCFKTWFHSWSCKKVIWQQPFSLVPNVTTTYRKVLKTFSFIAIKCSPL